VTSVPRSDFEEGCHVAHQQGQIFELKASGPDEKRLWAYRYRVGGRWHRDDPSAS